MSNEDWTLTLKPKRGLLEIDLKELWNYRDLITLFVAREFKAKYKQTILGPLWFIIQPILTTFMFTIVFGKIAGISTDGLPHILFYLSGIVCWNYFSTSLTATSQTFIQNAPIFGKVYFPRLTVPISIVLSNAVLFLIQFSLFIAVYLYYIIQGYNINFNYQYLWLLPILILLLAGLSLGFGIIISSMTTKYRDLVHLVQFGVQLWLYATPIIYPISAISGNLKTIILANPVSSIIETFRFIFFGTSTINWLSIGYSALFFIVIIFVGILLFNRIEKNFMDTV